MLPACECAVRAPRPLASRGLPGIRGRPASTVYGTIKYIIYPLIITNNNASAGPLGRVALILSHLAILTCRRSFFLSVSSLQHAPLAS